MRGRTRMTSEEDVSFEFQGHVELARGGRGSNFVF
jgi:hypothetical protein